MSLGTIWCDTALDHVYLYRLCSNIDPNVVNFKTGSWISFEFSGKICILFEKRFKKLLDKTSQGVRKGSLTAYVRTLSL